MFSRSSSNCSIATDEGLFELPEPLPHNTAAMENIIRRRSMQMHTEQQSWQVDFSSSSSFSNIDLINFGVHALCCRNLLKVGRCLSFDVVFLLTRKRMQY